MNKRMRKKHSCYECANYFGDLKYASASNPVGRKCYTTSYDGEVATPLTCQHLVLGNKQRMHRTNNKTLRAMDELDTLKGKAYNNIDEFFKELEI